MNIQISVVIWTVICFFVLMVILHNLLFKPMLNHLDKRNERIANAKEKQRREKKYAEELMQKAEAEATELNKSVIIEAERMVEEEQKTADTILDELKISEREKTKLYEHELEAEKIALTDQMEKDSARLAEILIADLVS